MAARSTDCTRRISSQAIRSKGRLERPLSLVCTLDLHRELGSLGIPVPINAARAAGGGLADAERLVHSSLFGHPDAGCVTFNYPDRVGTCFSWLPDRFFSPCSCLSVDVRSELHAVRHTCAGSQIVAYVQAIGDQGAECLWPQPWEGYSWGSMHVTSARAS